MAQTEYTPDDTPTALEEEIRWLMNRGRFDTDSENQTWGTSYTDVVLTSGPVAPHESLALASRHHSEDMARQNLFQHETVPDSGYYDADTQPQPWHRMTAEGYSWNRAAENIAAGYDSAEAAYEGWWNSQGHRHNMYQPEYREVGNGYFFWAASTYARYYTMDLGSSGSTHFFTGTVFHDANEDGAYTQGEGVAGLRVSLRVDGLAHDVFDVSSPVGSFAVPIQSIADGATVDVVLANVATSTITVHIPRDYSRYEILRLNPDETSVIGTFTQPAGLENVGFRNLQPVLPDPEAPALALETSGTSLTLRCPSQPDAEYLPQWTSDLDQWNDLIPEYETGTGDDLVWTLPDPTNSESRRLYRVLARRL